MPSRTAYKTAAWRNTLNWTMTYTLDADIVFPYGILEKRTPPHRNYSLVFQTKTKMAAWLVSNCNTHSRREAYVKQLKQYGVEVDIFGGCSGGNRVDGDETRRMINTSYMFYLAFENSLCTDYITEKFFVNFNLDVITVVRGGGNYSKLLPSDAFMNTADFHSVKALADQMLLVSKSEQVFTQYLREKDHFVGSVKLTDRSRNMCELCRKLNFLETNKNMYTNLVDKIHTRTCHEPSDIE